MLSVDDDIGHKKGELHSSFVKLWKSRNISNELLDTVYLTNLAVNICYRRLKWFFHQYFQPILAFLYFQHISSSIQLISCNGRHQPWSSEILLRALLKQNTALLSTFCPCGRGQVCHLIFLLCIQAYMPYESGPIKPYIRKPILLGYLCIPDQTSPHYTQVCQLEFLISHGG